MAASHCNWCECRRLIAAAEKDAAEAPPPDPRDWPIADLPVSLATAGLLELAGLIWVRDLLAVRWTAIPYCGVRHRTEIVRALQAIKIYETPS